MCIFNREAGGSLRLGICHNARLFRMDEGKVKSVHAIPEKMWT